MPDDRPDRHNDSDHLVYKTIRVEPLTPTVGAEISGVDLGQTLTALQFDEIHTALMRHAVIFFRDQQLTIEQHKAFGRRFGELDIHPTSRMAGHPEIIEIKADENSKYIAGEVWHSDVTASQTPPMGSILYMHQTPANGGGDTLFVNMYRAYETLAEPVRKMIDGMTAIHDGDRVWRGRQKKTVAGELPRSEHPVVRIHPVTGRRALFVNRNFTEQIVGLSRLESEAILDMLYRHSERDDFKCRFKWRPNSIAFWDNRCTMHQAMWDYFPQKRYGHRVTIAGTRP
jgi:taurine dioxygenase